MDTRNANGLLLASKLISMPNTPWTCCSRNARRGRFWSLVLLASAGTRMSAQDGLQCERPHQNILRETEPLWNRRDADDAAVRSCALCPTACADGPYNSAPRDRARCLV